MSDNEDSGDKQHEPTQKKLDDARKRGEVPRSTDLNAAAGYAGLTLAVMAFGGFGAGGLAAPLTAFLARPEALVDMVFDTGSLAVAEIVWQLLGPVAVWLGLPALAVLGSVLAQRSLVVAPEKLAPKGSRIDPISNAGQKFGRNGLFEFAKSAVKLCIYALVLGVLLLRSLPELMLSIRLSPDQAILILSQLTVEFLAISLAVTLAIAVVDFGWQQAEHLRKNRMSHKDLRDESKESEGDPHLKSARRGRAQEIALNQMLSDVPEADVIVVNPTHYSVALKWTRLPGSAPVCVAKGVDEIAHRIREVAQEAGVPIHSDPATARAIHAATEIGAEIAPEHYRPVAAAIRFAETMRQKARGR